jgi:hypothetical protein
MFGASPDPGRFDLGMKVAIGLERVDLLTDFCLACSALSATALGANSVATLTL